MLATPVPRPLSRLPLLLALPFLTVLGAIALSSPDAEPIWPESQGLSQAAPSCVMLLSEMGPPPASAAQGCMRTP